LPSHVSTPDVLDDFVVQRARRAATGTCMARVAAFAAAFSAVSPRSIVRIFDLIQFQMFC
jgi:hypothetical protein